MRATRAIVGAVVVLTLAAGVVTTAAPVPVPAGPSGFVVHEWGTFSSISGSDGALLKFHPANTDLPKFVHHGWMDFKSEYSGTVSLETPVLYFYSDRPVTA